MSDLDREQIELGITSIGEFDIDNCTCDASVGFFPCHYCTEREAILAGKRVLEQLADARAAARWLWPKVSSASCDAARVKWPWLKAEAAEAGGECDSSKSE